MASNGEKRRGRRIKTRFESFYETDRQEGSAVLSEISYSGALLQETSFQPELGSRVSVYVWLPNQKEPFELLGQVVRFFGSGFAVEYDEPGQDICNMVDAAAAVVTAGDNERSLVEVPEMVELSELDFSSYSLVELQEHAVRVEKEIARKREETKERLRGKMVQLAQREGLTLEEVLARSERKD
jgi:hypothetical protein